MPRITFLNGSPSLSSSTKPKFLTYFRITQSTLFSLLCSSALHFTFYILLFYTRNVKLNFFLEVSSRYLACW
nr:MAG TPA: hypothetical protein [Caudoviricetes sp.]